MAKTSVGMQATDSALRSLIAATVLVVPQVAWAYINATDHLHLKRVPTSHEGRSSSMPMTLIRVAYPINQDMEEGAAAREIIDRGTGS